MEKSSKKNHQNRPIYQDFFSFLQFFQNFTTIRSWATTGIKNSYQNTNFKPFRTKFERIFNPPSPPNITSMEAIFGNLTEAVFKIYRSKISKIFMFLSNIANLLLNTTKIRKLKIFGKSSLKQALSKSLVLQNE